MKKKEPGIVDILFWIVSVASLVGAGVLWILGLLMWLKPEHISSMQGFTHRLVGYSVLLWLFGFVCTGILRGKIGPTGWLHFLWGWCPLPAAAMFVHFGKLF